MSILLHRMHQKLKKTSTLILQVTFVLSLISTSAKANVIGTDAQNFNAVTNGLDFVTVHSSETLEPGLINVGLFFNLAVNTLPYFEPNPGSRIDFDDTLLYGDLNFGYGLTDNWDVGLSLPHLINQDVNSTLARGEFQNSGNTEIRINTKYRIWHDVKQGIAAIFSANFNRIQNNPYVGIDGGPVFNVEFAYDRTWKGIAFAANLGYRFRDPGSLVAPLTDIPIEPFDDQVIFSIGASRYFTSLNSKLILEYFASRPTKSVTAETNRSQSSNEMILGIKHDINTKFALHGGIGTELSNGNASPDWRFYTGINWVFGPYPKRQAPKTQSFGTPVNRIIVSDVLFEFDSDKINDEQAEKIFNVLHKALKDPPEVKKLIIEGHTDSIGRQAYNLDLSKRRAENVKKYLIEKHNFDEEKIFIVPFGEDRPIDDNGNYQGRQNNRRVEFKLIREID